MPDITEPHDLHQFSFAIPTKTDYRLAALLCDEFTLVTGRKFSDLTVGELCTLFHIAKTSPDLKQAMRRATGIEGVTP
jgi:hypothetical protein